MSARALTVLYLGVITATSLTVFIDLSANRFDCNPPVPGQHHMEAMGCAAQSIALASVAVLWLPAVPGLVFLLAPLGRPAMLAGGTFGLLAIVLVLLLPI